MKDDEIGDSHSERHIVMNRREWHRLRGARLDEERELLGGGIAGDRDSLCRILCGPGWLDGPHGWHGRIGAALVSHLNAGGRFVDCPGADSAHCFIAQMRDAGVVRASGQEDYLLDCLKASRLRAVAGGQCQREAAA